MALKPTEDTDRTSQHGPANVEITEAGRPGSLAEDGGLSRACKGTISCTIGNIVTWLRSREWVGREVNKGVTHKMAFSVVMAKPIQRKSNCRWRFNIAVEEGSEVHFSCATAAFQEGNGPATQSGGTLVSALEH